MDDIPQSVFSLRSALAIQLTREVPEDEGETAYFGFSLGCQWINLSTNENSCWEYRFKNHISHSHVGKKEYLNLSTSLLKLF